MPGQFNVKLKRDFLKGNQNSAEHPGITPGGEQNQDDNLEDVPQISLKGEARNKSEDEGGQVEEFGKHERGYCRD